MSSPRWITRLSIGWVSTRASLVPAGTVTVALAGAGGVSRAWSADGSLACGGSCAKQATARRKMAKNAADFVVVLLLVVKEEGVDETLGPQERRHVMGHLARKLKWRFRFAANSLDGTRLSPV